MRTIPFENKDTQIIYVLRLTQQIFSRVSFNAGTYNMLFVYISIHVRISIVYTYKRTAFFFRSFPRSSRRNVIHLTANAAAGNDCIILYKK